MKILSGLQLSVWYNCLLFYIFVDVNVFNRLKSHSLCSENCFTSQVVFWYKGEIKKGFDPAHLPPVLVGVIKDLNSFSWPGGKTKSFMGGISPHFVIYTLQPCACYCSFSSVLSSLFL